MFIVLSYYYAARARKKICCMRCNRRRGTNILHDYEPQQNLGRGCAHAKSVSAAPLIHNLPFQGGASVVVYSKCHCSSAFCLSLTVFYDSPDHLLGNRRPLGFLLLHTYFMPSKLYQFISHLVSRAGCGFRLFQFPIVVFIYF